MKKEKKIKNFETEGLTIKMKVEKSPLDINFEERQNLNKKIIRDIKIRTLIEVFRTALEMIGKVIEKYKELYQKTEFWEDKSELDYHKEEWNKIRKVNGRLTKYYNELKEIERKIKNV